MNQPRVNEEDVFLEAIRRAPEDREDFLERACAGNPNLRRRVEGLMDAHEKHDSILDEPPVKMADTRLPDHGLAPLGSFIGPYKLVEQIGEGGFGIVYLAEQHQPIRRDVALKIIKPGMDTRQVIARFEAERQALALMDHPNIAKVLDAGATESGHPFFVMELVKGVPITEYCDRCHLPINERLKLFSTVCQAVQHAHHKGVIHRDIKPTNVLIAIMDGQPSPKIIDFGVAKATSQRLTEKTLRTGFSQMLGTPMYMSPEQAEMSALDIDTRADIYALGVLLYELLTGTTPFEQSRLSQASYDEIRRVIREEDPPQPSARLSTQKHQSTGVAEHRRTDLRKLTLMLRGELDWICMKALEKDRTRRYETAGALAADIQRYLDGNAVEACPPSVGYRIRKLYQRNRLVGSVAILVLLIVLLASFVSVSLAIRARRAEIAAQNRFEREQTAHLAAEKAMQLEARQRELAERRLFESHLSEARALRRDRTAGRRDQSLARIEEAAEILKKLDAEDDQLLHLRNETIASLALLELEAGANWPGHPPRDAHHRIALDQQLEHYARLEPDGFVVIRQFLDNREVVRLPGLGNLIVRPELCLSPNGRFLAQRAPSAAGDRSELIVHRVSLRDREPPQIVLKTETGGVSWGSVLDFSADSSLLATVSPQGDITVFETETGQPKNIQGTVRINGVRVIRFDPDGRRIAVCNRSHVRIIDWRSGRKSALIPQSDTRSLAWSPDGTRIAAAGGDRKITIWDTSLGRPIVECHGNVAPIKHVAYNQQGDLLVSWSWDGGTRLWNPRNGQLILSAPGRGVRFSADDRFLGFAHAGESVGRYHLDRSPVLRTINCDTPEGAVTCLGFSPDAQVLFAGKDTGGVWFWNAAQGRALGHLPTARDVLFDRNGKQIFTAGATGIARWLADRDTSSGRLVFGSAQQWLSTERPGGGFQNQAVMTDDQQTLAFTESYGKLVFLNTISGEVQRRIDAAGFMNVSVSPDGRWAAAAPWNSFSAVNVWSLESGQIETRLPLPSSTSGQVLFSPDGRWLVTNDGSQCVFWSVGKWQQHWVLDGSGPIAFDRTGDCVAIALEGIVELYEIDSQRTLARLEAPDPHSISSLAWGPQGTRLAAGTSAGDVQLWDLRATRSSLSELGLDWNRPALLEETSNEVTYREIHFELGDQWQLWHEQAVLLSAAEEWAQAIESFARAVELGQQQDEQLPSAARNHWAGLHNSFAWLLGTCPDRALRDGERAVELAQVAVELLPEASYAWNTLGAAHLEAQAWDDAIVALEQSMALRSGGDSFDWFLLAMAHWKLGNEDEARRWYVKSVSWMDQNQPDDRELIQFRLATGTLMEGETDEAKQE